MKSIFHHKDIKAHIKKASKLGWCEQCTFPWYDGTCCCDISDKEEVAKIERLAGELQKQGYKL